MKAPSERIPSLILSLLLAASPLLVGCPAGSSTPAPEIAKSRPRTGEPQKHPDFLNGPIPPKDPSTLEEMAQFEKKKDQMTFLMELTATPAMEAAAMLETLKAPEYDERALRHHRLRIFQQLASEEILDDGLARAILRLGETLRQSSMVGKPSGVLFTSVVEAMVKSHDHLGEAEKGDILLDESLLTIREFLRTTPVDRSGSAPNPAPADSTESNVPPVSPQSQSPPSVTDHTSSPHPDASLGPAPRSPLPPKVVMTGDGAAKKHSEWRRLVEFKARRLARRDFPAADAFVQKECERARETMLARPDDLKAVREWLSLTALRASVAQLAGQVELAAAIDKEQEATVRSLAETHPDSGPHYLLHLTVRDKEVGRLIRREPLEAQKRLKEIRASVDGSKFAKDPAIAKVRESWEVYDRMINDSQFRRDLIGRPAPRFDVERWVHGEPLPLESLNGRVVLIVFCQINRQRCVELYPWLNSLHEEWHDRGLEVIHVVRPTRLTWNAVTNRAEIQRKRMTNLKGRPKIPDVTEPADPPGDSLAAEKTTPPDPAAIVEAEVQMLEQLATHYRHRFPTILVPLVTAMHNMYGAQMLPHLVVIDRQGIIR